MWPQDCVIGPLLSLLIECSHRGSLESSSTQPSNYGAKLPRGCDQTSGHLGMQLPSSRKQLHEDTLFISVPEVFLDLFLLSEADSVILSFSSTRVPIHSSFGIWHRDPEMSRKIAKVSKLFYHIMQISPNATIFLRHPNAHEVLLASCTLLSLREIILISKLFLLQDRDSEEFSWQSCSQEVPFPVSLDICHWPPSTEQALAPWVSHSYRVTVVLGIFFVTYLALATSVHFWIIKRKAKQQQQNQRSIGKKKVKLSFMVLSSRNSHCL